jgi:hypothetical protein
MEDSISVESYDRSIITQIMKNVLNALDVVVGTNYVDGDRERCRDLYRPTSNPIRGATRHLPHKPSAPGARLAP